MEHLNPEKRESLQEICFDHQDVFFLQGDILSCTLAAKRAIRLEPGTLPINTRPCYPKVKNMRLSVR
jgi:hypothetical protein